MSGVVEQLILRDRVIKEHGAGAINFNEEGEAVIPDVIGKGEKVDGHLPRFPHCPEEGAGKAVEKATRGGHVTISISGVGQYL